MLLSNLGEHDCTTITSGGTMGKKLKSETLGLQVLIQPFLLAPGGQLLALSSTCDLPTFILNAFLEIFLTWLF